MQRATMPLELEKYIPLAESIYANFGKNTEIVIHDLSHPENSVVYVLGDVTKRSIGAPATNLILEVLQNDKERKPEEEPVQHVCCYKTVTKDGKILRSSSTFIRNDQEEIIGCFCINYDITSWLQVKKMVDHLVAFSSEFSSGSAAQENPAHPNVETFSSGIDGVLQTLLNRTIYEMGGDVIRMLPEEKRQVVAQLSQRGFFNLKGAVSIVAKRLDVSEQTVYRYLRECQD